MKKMYLILAIALMSISSSLYAQGFTLQSSDIQGQLSNNQVLNGFGCKGKNISPKLTWKNVPKGTKSIAVTFYDKDAPTGSGFWHWMVFDIPANVKSLKRDAGNLKKSLAPKGSIQSTTSFGTKGFGGGCPPKGNKPHQYVFTAYALKVAKLGLDKDATPALVGFYLNNNVLAKSSIVAYLQR